MMLLWAVLVVVFYQCGLPLKFTWQLPALLWLWFAFPANRATLTGIIAALFFWFDPALIWNAHCWPQWDSWVLPFFLWAIVAASWDCWFIAGALIAAGADLPGQMAGHASMDSGTAGIHRRHHRGLAVANAR